MIYQTSGCSSDMIYQPSGLFRHDLSVEGVWVLGALVPNCGGMLVILTIFQKLIRKKRAINKNDLYGLSSKNP